jgi:predicted secreted protein
MAKVNGTSVVVKWNAAIIGGSTSATLNINVDLPDTTTKDSGGWAEHLHGLRDYSIDVDALHDPTNPVFDDTLAAAIIARATVTVIFEGAAGSIYTGKGSISSLSKTADMEQPVSYSVSITGTEPLVIS